MNTAKVYKDIDGNDCTIYQMVRREPEWAATRIQEGEKAIAKIEEDKYALDMAESEKQDVIRAAARMANALADIYNDIGEMPEVKSRVKTVELDIEHWAGCET